MRETTADRAVVLGEYILETGATVRAAAKVFKISKSTVHEDVAQRHIRGGMATKLKYISAEKTKTRP